MISWHNMTSWKKPPMQEGPKGGDFVTPSEPLRKKQRLGAVTKYQQKQKPGETPLFLKEVEDGTGPLLRNLSYSRTSDSYYFHPFLYEHPLLPFSLYHIFSAKLFT